MFFSIIYYHIIQYNLSNIVLFLFVFILQNNVEKNDNKENKFFSNV